MANRPEVKVPIGITTSLKVFLNKHTACDGELVTYVGDQEFRIGCSCEGRRPPVPAFDPDESSIDPRRI